MIVPWRVSFFHPPGDVLEKKIPKMLQTSPLHLRGLFAIFFFQLSRRQLSETSLLERNASGSFRVLCLKPATSGETTLTCCVWFKQALRVDLRICSSSATSPISPFYSDSLAVSVFCNIPRLSNIPVCHTK